MINGFDITTIDEADIREKQVIVRVDFDLSLNPDHSIADDTRLKRALPTIRFLLERKNRLILISKLGRPNGVNPEFSLRPVVSRLKNYLNSSNIILIDDFEKEKNIIQNQKNDEIIVLENIRFFPEEKNNDLEFAKRLASLGQIYVADAFAMLHRNEASVVGIPKFLHAFAGLSVKKEIEMISQVIKNPQKPYLAIIGGAKVSSKIDILKKLGTLADHILIGGAMANTFLYALGLNIQKSQYEPGSVGEAKKILATLKNKIILPQDSVTATDKTDQSATTSLVSEIPNGQSIFDIGPKSEVLFGNLISAAMTIIWNGPVGYSENPVFRRGTDYIYYSITQNANCFSLVGGGDTIAALSKKEYLDQITHISTGGGAMLEFIEKGTLPGLEALIRKK